MASDTVYVGQLICDSTTPPPDRGFYKINDTTTGHVGKLVMSDPVSGKESVALTATLSDGRVRVSAGGKPLTLLTSDPAPPNGLYEDSITVTANDVVRMGGGYVKQIRGISGSATVALNDSSDLTGRQLWTGTVAAGDVIDVNVAALNGVSVSITGGTATITVAHGEIK